MTEPTRRRWYEDACGAAHGLELLGERWALLVVRELLLGPRRFSELRAGLPGLSANVLAQRLEGLEAAGVLVRRARPPASAGAYELTSWGYEAGEVVRVLGRWAARSPGHDPGLPISAVSLVLSFRAMFDPARAGAARLTLGLRLGAEGFLVRVAGGEVAVARGVPEGADAVVEGTPEAVAALVYGGAPPEACGARITAGEPEVLARFAAMFPLPEKAGSEGALPPRVPPAGA